MDGPRVQRFPLRYGKANILLPEPILQIPFWDVQTHYSLTAMTKDQQRAYGTLMPWTRLLIPAFWSPVSDMVQTLTYHYSLIEKDTIQWEQRNGRLWPVTRNPESLEAIARILWTARLDRACDTTGVRVTVQLSDPWLSVLPFAREPDGRGFRDGLTGARFPGALFR